jgi:WD40 repeat protein
LLGTAKLWDGTTGHPIGSKLDGAIRTNQGVVGVTPVNAVAFAPDGKTVLVGCEGGAKLWDASGRLIAELSANTTRGAVAFSPDGRSVLTGSGSGIAQLWDTKAGRPIGEPTRHLAAVTCVAYSPSGETIATGCQDGTARLWNATTGQSLGDTMRHSAGITAVAFAPDGETVLTASTDKTARLWDASTGLAIGRPMGHNADVNAVAFAPDGKTILTGSSDGSARLWKVPRIVSGTPDQIANWVDVMTGTELIGDAGEIQVLRSDAWARKRAELNASGGPLPPNGPE